MRRGEEKGKREEKGEWKGFKRDHSAGTGLPTRNTWAAPRRSPSTLTLAHGPEVQCHVAGP